MRPASSIAKEIVLSATLRNTMPSPEFSMLTVMMTTLRTPSASPPIAILAQVFMTIPSHPGRFNDLAAHPPRAGRVVGCSRELGGNASYDALDGPCSSSEFDWAGRRCQARL
jgi:hypothetical protein